MGKHEILEGFDNLTLLDGIHKSYKNGCDLFEEAKILKNNGKQSRAYTLYQLSIEEFGKGALIWWLFLDRTKNKRVDYKELTYNFTKHQFKTNQAQQLANAQYFIAEKHLRVNTQDLKEVFTAISTPPKDADLKKNASLYVDFDNNGFNSPSNIISNDDLIQIETSATMIRLNLTFLSKLDKEKINEFVDFFGKKK